MKPNSDAFKYYQTDPQMPGKASSPWKRKLYVVIFHSDTRLGKRFDLVLLVAILASVGLVMAESVRTLEAQYGEWLAKAEWFFTGLFALEYLARIACVRRKHRYILSFFGLVDLLSILPTFIDLLVPGAHHLMVVRSFRLLRVFRILKLSRFLGEAQVLSKALRASLPKITVFLTAVLSLALILGTLMYLIEGPENGFTSIPRSIYWSIVTLTTVGYGDIAPQTVPGQFLAAMVMVLGYGIIAVPTGIVSVELSRSTHRERNRQVVIEEVTCPQCGTDTHQPDAQYCRVCGADLYDKAYDQKKSS